MTATAMTPPTMTILRQLALMSAPVPPTRISTLRSRFVHAPLTALSPPYTFISCTLSIRHLAPISFFFTNSVGRAS
eukprot:5741163-Pleurochrysis_carterae.AAC.1